MWQIEYHREGQSHLFDVATQALALEWLDDLFSLAMVSWVIAYDHPHGHNCCRRVRFVKDKTGKCPVKA